MRPLCDDTTTCLCILCPSACACKQEPRKHACACPRNVLRRPRWLAIFASPCAGRQRKMLRRPRWLASPCAGLRTQCGQCPHPHRHTRLCSIDMVSFMCEAGVSSSFARAGTALLFLLECGCHGAPQHASGERSRSARSMRGPGVGSSVAACEPVRGHGIPRRRALSSATVAHLPCRLLCPAVSSQAACIFFYLHRPALACCFWCFRPRALAQRPQLQLKLLQRINVCVHIRESILHLLSSDSCPIKTHEPLQLLRIGSHGLALVQAGHGLPATLDLAHVRFFTRCILNRHPRLTRRPVTMSSHRHLPPARRRRITASGIVHKMSAQCFWL
jgi:hypothetical protein